MNTAEFTEINTLMQAYFDGLYKGDLTILKHIFHPKAQYICATEDITEIRSMPEYFEKVQQRTSPESLNQIRKDVVTSIQFAGPNTALVIAQCTIEPKYFIDHLCLIKEQSEWKIIAKNFHYDMNRSAK